MTVNPDHVDAPPTRPELTLSEALYLARRGPEALRRAREGHQEQPPEPPEGVSPER